MYFIYHLNIIKILNKYLNVYKYALIENSLDNFFY